MTAQNEHDDDVFEALVILTLMVEGLAKGQGVQVEDVVHIRFLLGTMAEKRGILFDDYKDHKARMGSKT